MFSQIIVLVVLSVMSVTAAYAVVVPVAKSPQEQNAPEAKEKNSTNAL
jgi:hypothetical protein